VKAQPGMPHSGIFANNEGQVQINETAISK
jgi:hypothetical protein